MSDELQPEVTGPASWWSVPSAAYVGGQYISGGKVWMETYPTTLDHMKESLVYYSQPHALGATPMPGTPPSEQSYDKLSMVGRYDRRYNSFFYAVDGKRNPAGGEGSDTYELQHVGKGVKLTNEPIWFFNSDGDMVKEVPVNGYHRTSDDVNREGPEPGSEAEKLLGDGSYQWDAENALWIIV